MVDDRSMKRSLRDSLLGIQIGLPIVFLVAPRGGVVQGVAVVASSVGLATALVWRARRERCAFWTPLAAFWILVVISNGLWYGERLILHTATFPSPIDGVYLAAYAAMTAALARTQRRTANVGATLDASIVVAGLAAPLWVGIVRPALDLGTDPTATAVALAYPAVELLALWFVLRGILSGTFAHSVASTMTASAIAIHIGADLWYSYGSLTGRYVVGGPTDVLWLGAYLAGTLAAFHGSPVLAPAAGRRLPSAKRAMLFLPVAAVTAAMSVGEDFGLPRQDSPFVGAMSIALLGLVLARIGHLLWIVGQQTATLVDTTDRLTSREQELDAAAREIDGILRASPAAIIRVDAEARAITFASPNFEAVTGWPAEVALGRQDSLRDHVRVDDLDGLDGLDGLERIFASASPEQRVQFECRQQDQHGAWRTLAVVGAPQAPSGDGSATRVLFITDVSAAREAEHALRHQALHDPLTGLASRALLIERIEDTVEGSETNGRCMAVSILDLDDFKAVNDALGHAAGDALLVQVGERLDVAVPPDGTVGRFGADEFTMLLPAAAGPCATLSQVMRRILDVFDDPFHLEDRDVFVRATAGVRIVDPGDTSDAAEILRDADAALYQAKATAKGAWLEFEPDMRSGSMLRLSLGSELHLALERDEFVLQYQPIVELTSGRMVGAEALVRWRSPDRGMVPPDEFIPVAEDTGLIVPLGRWVLREAVRQAAVWNRTDPLGFRISVNVSVLQLREPSFVADIMAVLAETGLPPRMLAIEVTESILVETDREGIAALRAIDALGVRVHVDDFGTGYASLGYLGRLPVDGIKIDKMFVDGVDGTPEDSAVARAVCTVARMLEFKLVGEGIERVEQADRLRDLGCQFGQGFYFSKPLDAEAIERLILEDRPLEDRVPAHRRQRRPSTTTASHI